MCFNALQTKVVTIIHEIMQCVIQCITTRSCIMHYI